MCDLLEKLADDGTGKDFSLDVGNGVLLEMAYIPGGTFWMGSTDGEGVEREHPRH